MTVADCITASRVVAAPCLPLAATTGSVELFTGIVAFGLASDALDGPVARRLKLDTSQGARFDTYADLTFYSATLIGLAVLVPGRLSRDWVVFAAGLLAYVTPMVAALCKFGRITSYHTMLDRLSLAMLAVGLLSWLWFDRILPLQIAVTVFVLAALEELVLTWKLQEPRDNVAHMFQLQGLDSRGR